MRLPSLDDRILTRRSRRDTAQRRRLLEVKAGLEAKLRRDNPGEWLSWWIAEDAVELPKPVIDKLRRAGPALKAFFGAANRLFLREPWIQRRLEKHLSPYYALLNRAQPEAIPWLPRPDVVLDRDWRPKLVELEITVCARFDTAVMAEQYGLDPEQGLVRNYARHFKRHWPGQTLGLLATPHPVWWYVIDEVIPFAERLRREGVDALVLGGEELARLRFDGHALLLRQPDGHDRPIHVFDRFIDIYEIAELQHPGMAPLLDAYLTGAVSSVNTCKQFLDEKDWLSLFWDAGLREAWRCELGAEHDGLLREMLPRTWQVAPGTQIELPSGGSIPIERLAELPVEERAFVIKESGTSSTASGAQSLRILSEMSARRARSLLRQCLNDQSRPFIIQEIIDSPRVSFVALDPENGDTVVTEHGARIKLSVFYVDGRMTDIKFIASNRDLAVNNRDCVEGVVRY